MTEQSFRVFDLHSYYFYNRVGSSEKRYREQIGLATLLSTLLGVQLGYEYPLANCQGIMDIFSRDFCVNRRYPWPEYAPGFELGNLRYVGPIEWPTEEWP